MLASNLTRQDILEKVKIRCLRLTYDQPILQTLEEKRHITDMVDTFKYVHQLYKPKAELLFKIMDDRGVALRLEVMKAE